MEMGSMDMGDGVPGLFYLQQMYWAVVGTAIGIAALVHILNYLLYRQRLSAARRNDSTPAKPKNLFVRWTATVTAVSREVINCGFPTISFSYRVYCLPGRYYHNLGFRSFPMGKLILLAANIVTVIVLCFYKLDPKDKWQWEDIGYRTGFITICQLPLLFLLAGKHNIIGYLTGSSYERLTWLHVWAARTLFLTATIHMGYWFTSWDRYNYISTKVKTDAITQKGLAAWGILGWIILSSIGPIRALGYEFFVIQHLISFTAFITLVYMHTPAEVHVWIWIPVGLFFFDRLVRALSVFYINLSLFHPKRRQATKGTSPWASQAEFTHLPNNATRITISNPPLTSWAPGQHVFLSCHSLAPLQSHPFTIASLPSDGKMEFIVQAKGGGTRRFFDKARKHAHSHLPTHTEPERDRSREDHGGPDGITLVRNVSVEGPYGRIRPLHQFDTVVFIAGSAGATFTLPLLRDLVRRWQIEPESVVTRRVHFVWAVKKQGHCSWFARELDQVMSDMKLLPGSEQPNAEVKMQVFVTCESRREDNGDRQGEFQLPGYRLPNVKNSNSTHGAPTDAGMETEDSVQHEKASEGATDQKNAISVREVPGASSRSSSSSEDVIQNIKGKAQDTAEGQGCPCACSAASQPGKNTKCCCDGSSSLTTSLTPTSSTELPAPFPFAFPKPFSSSAIGVRCGRPSPAALIRPALEEALGETGVVTCGPHSLVDEVRRTVARLSDERAVHKGTGAQGIWLHCEEFGYGLA